MSENIQGHLLKFKNANGEWVALPIAIVNVYDIYVAYCQTKGVQPVTEQTYYDTLGNLQSLVNTITDSTDSINRLTEALDEGMLPVNLGGTGCNTEESMFTYMYNGLKAKGFAEQSAVDALSNEVDKLSKNSTSKNNFSYGDNAPGPGTQGTYYFEY